MEILITGIITVEEAKTIKSKEALVIINNNICALLYELRNIYDLLKKEAPSQTDDGHEDTVIISKNLEGGE